MELENPAAETAEPELVAEALDVEPEAPAPLADVVLDVAPEIEAPVEPVPELPADVELEAPATEPEATEPEPVAEALDVEPESPAPLADVVLNVAPEAEVPTEPAPELPADVDLEAPTAGTAEPEPVAEALNVEPEAPSTAEEKLMDDIAAAMTEPHPSAEPDEPEFPEGSRGAAAGDGSSFSGRTGGGARGGHSGDGRQFPARRGTGSPDAGRRGA